MNSAEAQPSSKTRNERVMRREHVRKEEEREFEGMSKEEEDQIKQAIALSILDKNGLGEENEVSPTSEEDKVSQTSLPIDEDHTEKNTINSGQQLSDSQVSDGFGDNADEVGNVDKHEQGNIKEKDDNKDAQVSDGFGDNADEVGNVDKHKQGSIELDEKDDNNDQSKDDFTFPYSVESHSSPKQQEVGDNKGNGDNVEDGDNNGRCDNDKDDDNSDNSDKTDMDYECGRSSPLFESEPDICLVEDEDMTQISHQSSIHSEMDIFAVRKDRLSLKKRKREPVDTEQPRKTPKLETSVHNKKEEESSEIFPSSEPYIPLKCVDKRPILKKLKPLYAPDNANANDYTSIILTMLNKQLQIFRSAQRELSKFAAMGSPVQVGPFMRGCLKYRKRSEKPFVFFDSSDDEPEEINKSGKTVKSQSDALGENNRNVNSARKRRTQSVIHNTSDSDFETEPKKPKLSKQQKNPEKSGLDIKNEEILDDDVLYAGETQPFFEDDINEQLDDSLLNDSPVQIVSVESDQETDDGQDADGQSGQPSGHIDSQNLDKSTENSEDKSSNDLKLKSDNFVDDDAVLDDVIESILEDDKEPHQNENEPKKHFQDGNDSDVSSGSGPIVIREKRPDNSQGFFARKRRADTGASTSRGLRSRPREQSPEIPLKSQRSESPSSKLTNFDIDKNGIACPLCNVLFHPDMILRHASECNGPVEEETTNKETEPIEITEVLNSEDDNSTGSQMEHDHTGGWVFSEAVTTPVAKYGSKKKTIFKPAEEGDVYRISSSSDEDILPSRRTSHDNISSGPDHIDQVVSDMVGRKQMSISVPKATKRQRTKQQSKNRVKEEAMETCFMCKKLVPKSEYPEHVNAELEKQNMEESLHVESQQPSTSIGERVRKTAKRNTRKKEKIEDDEEKEEGDLDDLIAFSHKKTQEDDGDYDVEDDVEIDEYSDNEDTPTGGEFDVSDSPIKAFRNIKNMPSGFIDYNNQFNNKPKRGGQVNEKSYFPTTSKPQSRGRRKRGGRGRGGGRFRKKK